eukprot:Rhum_TRINITY_DN14229_c6_g2::Rhum_TRINITY_DN14229_c6_g2_i1::g.74704::m.74704
MYCRAWFASSLLRSPRPSPLLSPPPPSTARRRDAPVRRRVRHVRQPATRARHLRPRRRPHRLRHHHWRLRHVVPPALLRHRRLHGVLRHTVGHGRRRRPGGQAQAQREGHVVAQTQRRAAFVVAELATVVLQRLCGGRHPGVRLQRLLQRNHRQVRRVAAQRQLQKPRHGRVDLRQHLDVRRRRAHHGRADRRHHVLLRGQRCRRRRRLLLQHRRRHRNRGRRGGVRRLWRDVKPPAVRPLRGRRRRDRRRRGRRVRAGRRRPGAGGLLLLLRLVLHRSLDGGCRLRGRLRLLLLLQRLL